MPAGTGSNRGPKRRARFDQPNAGQTRV
jgi:hypothetical protein